MKVCERFNIRRHSGLIGLEIEVEGEDLPKKLNAKWKITEDNSLRGESAEYVFAKPLSQADAYRAIDHLVNAFKDSNTKPSLSHRTSVHVHLDVCEMTRNQVLNFIFLGYLFDRVLSHIGGREIQGNRFALRISDAEEQVFLFKKFCENKGIFPALDNAKAKYSAVNIVPVCNYGSVEFRSMRGTVDPSELKSWIEILVNIRNYSLKYKSIKEMIDGIYGNELEFTKRVLGGSFIPYQGLVDDIRINLSLLVDIPHIIEYDEDLIEQEGGGNQVIPDVRVGIADRVINAAPQLKNYDFNDNLVALPMMDFRMAEDHVIRGNRWNNLVVVDDLAAPVKEEERNW